jgi:hypothetical protein
VRRALVNIGHPDLKRHRRDLETERDQTSAIPKSSGILSILRGDNAPMRADSSRPSRRKSR